MNYYLPPNFLFLVPTLVGGGTPHYVVACGSFLVIITTISTSLSVVALGDLVTMGIAITILLEAVITRVRTVRTAPFFLEV